MTTELTAVIAEQSVSVAMIWAQTTSGVIGADGTMPWHLPEDLAHFKAKTHGHPVIMGRGTWDSLPPRFRPLAGRHNIVVSRSLSSVEGAEIAPSPAAAIRCGAAALEPGAARTLWVIGGAKLYRQFADVAARAEVTQIDADIVGDAFAPELDDRWSAVATGRWQVSEKGMRYRFISYESDPTRAR